MKRLSVLVLMSISMLMLFTLPLPCHAELVSASPVATRDAVEVIEIKTKGDLHTIVRNTPAGNYILMNDIDLNLSAAAGWEPIGTATNPFEGTFDGNGYTISGLWIKRPNTNNVGLFGTVTGTIKNLKLELAEAGVTGKDNVGGLVGTNKAGTIDSCSVSGKVKGVLSVGGLVGQSTATYDDGGYVTAMSYIRTCSSSAVVEGNTNVGGLLGYHASSWIDDGCHASGAVEGNMYVGGLVGNNDGNIFKSYSTGAVKCFGEAGAGGLSGANRGTIFQCYSTSSVTGLATLGGLVGMNGDGTAPNVDVIEQCYAAGLVFGSVLGSGDSIGGLVGCNRGTVKYSVFDTDSTGRSKGIGSGSSGVANARTTLQMCDSILYVYAGWEFDVWGIRDGCSYPYLKSYESVPGSCVVVTPPVVTPPAEPDPPVVTPPARLQITGQSRDRVVHYGESCDFSVDVEGGDGVKWYQWYCEVDGERKLLDVESSWCWIPTPVVGEYEYYCKVMCGSESATNAEPMRLTVLPAPLEVRAVDTFCVYGEEYPVARVLYSGFVLGEDTSVLSVVPSVYTDLPVVSSVGEYVGVLKLAGGSAMNYSLTYLPGALTITRGIVSRSLLSTDLSVLPVSVVVSSSVVGVGVILRIKYGGLESLPVSSGIYPVTIDISEGLNYSAITDLYVGDYELVNPDVVATTRPVVLPILPDIPLLPSGGMHHVPVGSSFAFEVFPPLLPGSLLPPITITTSRSTDATHLLITPTPPSYTVLLRDVREALSVVIRLNPVSSTPTESAPRVWSSAGQLHISSFAPLLVRIYSIGGTLLSMQPVIGTFQTYLPTGIYIVDTGKEQHKVLIH